jgi:hypothetical protein
VGGRRAVDFVAFDCTSQEKAAHSHVVYAVQEVPKTALKDAKTGSYCRGNEVNPPGRVMQQIKLRQAQHGTPCDIDFTIEHVWLR